MTGAMVCSGTGTNADYNLPGVTVLAAAGTIALATGTMYYQPIRVNDPINVTAVGIYVDTAAAAGKVGIIGVYPADVNLDPNGASVEASPISMAIDATGAVASATIDLDLDRGTYLVSWQANANCTLRTMGGVTPDTLGFDSDFSTWPGVLSATRAYDGTNPATGPAWTPGAAGSLSGFDFFAGLAYTIL